MPGGNWTTSCSSGIGLEGPAFAIILDQPFLESARLFDDNFPDIRRRLSRQSHATTGRLAPFYDGADA